MRLAIPIAVCITITFDVKMSTLPQHTSFKPIVPLVNDTPNDGLTVAYRAKSPTIAA